MGGDPVQLGIVAALNRPNGNATGVCFMFNVLGPKRLELLREVVPSAKVIGYLVNRATSMCAMHRISTLPSLALRTTG